MIPLNTTYRRLVEAKTLTLKLGGNSLLLEVSPDDLELRKQETQSPSKHSWDIHHKVLGPIGVVRSRFYRKPSGLEDRTTLNVSGVWLYMHPDTGKSLSPYNSSQTLGPSVVRKLAKQIRRDLPSVKRIASTNRVTGVRGKSGSSTLVKPVTLAKRY